MGPCGVAKREGIEVNVWIAVLLNVEGPLLTGSNAESVLFARFRRSVGNHEEFGAVDA